MAYVAAHHSKGIKSFRNGDFSEGFRMVLKLSEMSKLPPSTWYIGPYSWSFAATCATHLEFHFSEARTRSSSPENVFVSINNMIRIMVLWSVRNTLPVLALTTFMQAIEERTWSRRLPTSWLCHANLMGQPRDLEGFYFAYPGGSAENEPWVPYFCKERCSGDYGLYTRVYRRYQTVCTCNQCLDQYLCDSCLDLHVLGEEVLQDQCSPEHQYVRVVPLPDDMIETRHWSIITVLKHIYMEVLLPFQRSHGFPRDTGLDNVFNMDIIRSYPEEDESRLAHIWAIAWPASQVSKRR
ncbi:hypothetical protein F5Y15DRAFT_31878 [Xylariaceae sp. FL0016]|nr:hypothetical protein F5Y15DRAFT_31878 [Xylariaceae sp. FL0016]